jgi:hypothetical protein
MYRSRDDVVEDDLFGQQVEEVPTIGNAIEALLDDAKERVKGFEVVEVGVRRRHDGGPVSVHACAVRRAKSAN